MKRARAKHIAFKKVLDERASRGSVDPVQLVEFETGIEILEAKSEAIAPDPTELDRSEALQKTIEFHKSAEFVIVSLTKRRKQALEMLDLYRAGLGRHKAINDIFDAECEVTGDRLPTHPSPLLAPRIETPVLSERQSESVSK